MGKLCSVVGDKITPCEVLAAALEYGNPRPKSKGIFLPERVNINTGGEGYKHSAGSFWRLCRAWRSSFILSVLRH